MSTPDRDKTAPPAAGPKPGQNTGYAESGPRDKDDAKRPPRPPREEPEEGGLRRKPDADPDPTKD